MARNHEQTSTLGRIWRYVVRLFAVVGFLFALTIGVVWAAAYRYFEAAPPEPQNIVLELDLRGGLTEFMPADPLANLLSGRVPTLRDAVAALDKARLDPKVKGVVALIGEDRLGLAQAQELRDAVARFRETGRFAYAYSTSFGEFGPGNGSYYLASSFEEIWLQPIGTVGLTGFVSEVPFAREALDEIGVTAQIDHRGQYKSAPETFTEIDFTPAHRAMIQSLIGDLTRQLVAGVAESRGLKPEQVQALIDGGPYVAKEALAAKLVDRLDYQDVLRDELLRKAGDDSDFVSFVDYAPQPGDLALDGRPRIAMITGVGLIAQGSGEAKPLIGGPGVESDRIADAFREAAEDDRVAAIVFRIDSGGGSAVASETIRRAVVQARAKGKPVIVSMGDTAASGGYWVSMNADAIVAQPATLTGSIGVFAGKILTQDLWDKLGVNWGLVAAGEHAAIWSNLVPYSPEEEARLDALLDDIYDAFVTNVAEARGLTVAQVQAIAQGRVWTGAQAKENGLVDALGGLETALILAREKAGLTRDETVAMVDYPRPRGPFEAFLELTAQEGGVLAGLERRADARVAERLAPALEPLQPLLAAPGERALVMTPVGRIR